MFDKYLDIFMPSKDMREYLKTELKESDARRIKDIIWYADINIQDKLAALKELINESSPEDLWDDVDYIDKTSDMIKGIEYALGILKDDNGVYQLESSYYTTSARTSVSDFYSLYSSFEKALKATNELVEYEDPDIQNTCWAEITKWEKDENGDMVDRCTYYIINKEIRYIDLENSYLENNLDQLSSMIGRGELYLPVPFKSGDIVEIDGRPFIPYFHALIVDIGDNMDCCCVQGLAKDENGLWNIGAVKHNDIGPYSYPEKSMLYLTSIYDGELPEDEKLLKKASDILKAHPEYAQEFMWRMHGYTDEEFDAFLDSLGNTGYVVPGPFNCQLGMR